MATRIRVRKGDTEVEYEGSEQFLKNELSSLLRAASTFPAGSGRQAPSPAPRGARPGRAAGARASRRKGAGTRITAARAVQEAPAGKGQEVPAGRGADAPPGSTAGIAARIGCSHGTHLVLAAAAQLNLRAGRKSFSRAELLAAMKTAAQYYKPVYGKNLSRYLKSLIKERQLNQPRPGIYALTAPARREMQKILAA